jgi:hypothetical protein
VDSTSGGIVTSYAVDGTPAAQVTSSATSGVQAMNSYFGDRLHYYSETSMSLLFGKAFDD